MPATPSTTPRPTSGAIRRRRSPADLRPNLQQLREEGQVQCGAQEPDARRAAGPALVADDPLHRLHVPEAPQLEGLLDVDELLAHLVLLPVAIGVLVDALEHLQQTGVARVR